MLYLPSLLPLIISLGHKSVSSPNECLNLLMNQSLHKNILVRALLHSIIVRTYCVCSYWLVRNCLLLLMLKFDSHLIFLAYGYLKKFPNCVHIISFYEANDPNFNTQRYSAFLLREENLNYFMIRSAWACNTSNPIDAEGEWLTDRCIHTVRYDSTSRWMIS